MQEEVGKKLWRRLWGANSPLIVNLFIGISLGNNAVIAHRWKKVKKGLAICRRLCYYIYCQLAQPRRWHEVNMGH